MIAGSFLDLLQISKFCCFWNRFVFNYTSKH